MTNSLIAAKGLAKAVEDFLPTYRSVMERAHVIAVSTLHYTANSGRVDILNKFYSGLSASHQADFRGYVGRIMGTVAENQWLAFESNLFSIIPERQPARDDFKTNVDKWLNPDPNVENGRYQSFTVKTTNRNDGTNDPFFTGVDFGKRLKSLVGQAIGDKSRMSDQTKEAARRMLDDWNALMEREERASHEAAKINAAVAAQANQNETVTSAKVANA